MKPEIFSEIGPLEKVFVYSPGEEHNLVSPSDVQPFVLKDGRIIENENFLLFDDIIDLKLAQKQHKIFRDIINFYKEDSCIDVRPYLDEIDQEFGKDVASLVNGVSKLGGISFSSRKAVQAEEDSRTPNARCCARR